ncbi:MAG TPA: NIPSNAP family protein [Stellaceae bacterium]
MIIDERTYTIHIGKIPDYLNLYQAEGLEIQSRTLGHLIGYFVTEIGALSTVVHLWAYDSLEERTRRRAALGKDPAWQAYLARMQPLVTAMENRIASWRRPRSRR